jgi:hypothetical protein
MQLVVGRGEIVNFEPMQVLFHGSARTQHDRHGDKSAQFGRHAVAQREAGQSARAHATRHGAVDQCDCDIECRDRAQQA